MDNKYIGILTSGGDASGMNAAIRAVTRAAIFNGFKVKGIYRGYEGLIAGEVKELTTEDVSSIIQRGGTILKTARSETFTTPEGRKKAYKVIQKENINVIWFQHPKMDHGKKHLLIQKIQRKRMFPFI